MKIALLVYENCSSWGVGGAIEILNMANKIYSRYNKEYFNRDFFEIQLVSTGRRNISTRHNFNLYCDKTIKDNIDADFIIVPGILDDFKTTLEKNCKMIEWLKEQYSKGIAIASFCTGLIFLADAGIIDYKCASTHWMAEKFIRENFPKVNLQIRKTIVDDGNIYSCGGSASFQNLILYLIEKFMGRKYAVDTSRFLLIDINKDSQTSYSIFNYHNHHNDQSILRVQNLIDKKYSEKLTLEELSNYAAMSQRNFIRRFKKATGENPGTYIQKVKIESAKRMLEKGNSFSIEEIAFKIGYEDISSFRGTFKKYTGVSPSDYKAKFNRRLEN